MRLVGIVGLLCSGEGVEHEHTDGHGTDTAGDGSDGTSNGGYAVKVDIAREAEAGGAGGIGHAGGADIDDGGAGLDHIGRDVAGAADGGDEDVGLAAFTGEVFGVGVDAGDGGVAVLLLQHELHHGFAHDVAAPYYDALPAGGGDAVAPEEGEDAQWGGTDEAGQADGEATNVDGVEAIDVLAMIDGLDDFLAVDVAGEGQLDDEAVDASIVVELVDFAEEFGFADGVFETDEGAFKSAGFAGEYFIANVGFATAVVAHKDGGEVGTLMACGHEGFDLLCDFGFDLGGCGFAVDEDRHRVRDFRGGNRVGRG